MALEGMDFALSFRLLGFVTYCLGKIMNECDHHICDSFDNNFKQS